MRCSASPACLPGSAKRPWTYPDLIDYFSETEKFRFTGIAQGTLNGSEIRATMDGDLVYWVAPTLNATWFCRTTDHTVIFRR